MFLSVLLEWLVRGLTDILELYSCMEVEWVNWAAGKPICWQTSQDTESVSADGHCDLEGWITMETGLPCMPTAA